MLFFNLSLLFFGILHSNGYIFPFLLCFLLLFFSQLFIRPPQTAILLFSCLFLGMVLLPVSCTMSQTSIHSSSGTLSIRMNGISSLTKAPPQICQAPSALWWYNEKSATGRRSSSSCHIHLRLSASITVQNEFLLFISYSIYVVAAVLK